MRKNENAVTDKASSLLNDMDQRARDIFREIVENYLSTGDPMGSRTLSQLGHINVSPATIRNVMADLEHMGLLTAPHTSAGRLPTQMGLRLFVDGLLEVGDLTEDDQQNIAARLAGTGQNMEDVLTQASTMLSGLSHCAGLVMSPKTDAPLKHIEFVVTSPGQALVVIVTEDGMVENRVVTIPIGMPPSALTEASNFLNTRLRGKTLEQVQDEVARELETAKQELDDVSAKLIETGLATWSGEDVIEKSLIVRGRSHLLDNVEAAADLERVRLLFDDLENKKDVIQLMELAKKGEGVRVFIGSENNLFSLTGSSLIVSPYMDSQQKIIGVLGVIGPTRLNYARVVPLVDYTAKIVGKVLS